MRLRLRFPILVKLTTVCVALLMLAMVPTAFVTISAMKREATDREKATEEDLAAARASETMAVLKRFYDNAAFIGRLLATEAARAGAGRDSAQRLLDQDPDLLSLDVHLRGAAAGAPVLRLVNAATLANLKVDQAYLGTLDRERPFPVSEAFSRPVVLKNRSMPAGAPVLTMSVPVAKDDKTGQTSAIVVVNLRLAPVQRMFAEAGIRTLYLVDQSGTVLAHPKESLTLKAANLRAVEVVRRAIATPTKAGQVRYLNRRAKEYFISAYQKVADFGLIVVAEARESEILKPAERAKMAVVLATMIALSLSFIIAAAMAMTITRPVKRLERITREIARGNFGLQVARLVSTNDEVGTLAVSFDTMLAGLRERDKVKKLFSKFHGSRVAESLMAAERVEMGGSRRQVVVFFSDIRGFTDTSEKTSPENVVKMLNEYFTVMVRIIDSHNGVVDKFIGDAIMAVWGAPVSTGEDCLNAVKASLAMRRALAELNAVRQARGEPALWIGMGLHTGEAISGNIGSDEKLEYTVIGDTVNMASRIEGATKAFGADLLISETVAAAVKGKILFEEAGRTKVKGKAKPFALYKVRGIIRDDGVEELIQTEFSDYPAEKADKVEVV